MTIPEAFIVSYPKMGRTWLRVMLGKYLCDQLGLTDERNLLKTEGLTEACGLLRTQFMHGQSGFDQQIHWRDLNPDRSKFRDKRVVLLGRDIRDTLVSAHLWTSKRLQIFDGPISAFIRDDYLGAPKLLTYYRHWHDARAVPKAFMFLRYEDMHRDAVGTLARVLEFLGAAKLDAGRIRDAIAYASFENLRQLEVQQNLKLTVKKATESAQPSPDPDALKIRRGKVGKFVEYLSPEDIAYVDQLNAAMGCEFTR